eukprot:2384376-Lingulodinium_polyedra.AAC.1
MISPALRQGNSLRTLLAPRVTPLPTGPCAHPRPALPRWYGLVVKPWLTQPASTAASATLGGQFMTAPVAIVAM